MPQAVAFQPAWSGMSGSIQVWINFNQSNLRIQTVEWANTTNRSLRARIWNNGTLVYDQTKPPGMGTENVPGNHQMVMVNGSLELPPNITTHFEIV